MNDASSPGRPRRAAFAGAAVLAVAAVGGIAWQQQQHASRAAEGAAWDLNRAMDLAGAQVPAEVESFYFFVVEPAGDPAGELAAQFAQAVAERDYVGITGADSRFTRAVVLDALAASGGGRRIAGLVVIYLGPPEQEPELRAAAERQGVELRFVPYAPGREREGI